MANIPSDSQSKQSWCFDGLTFCFMVLKWRPHGLPFTNSYSAIFAPIIFHSLLAHIHMHCTQQSLSPTFRYTATSNLSVAGTGTVNFMQKKHFSQVLVQNSFHQKYVKPAHIGTNINLIFKSIFFLQYRRWDMYLLENKAKHKLSNFFLPERKKVESDIL